MGTERSYDILTRMRAEARDQGRGALRAAVSTRSSWRKPAGESELRATGVVLEDGTRLTADAVIAAPGRDGAAWLREGVQAACTSRCAPTRWTSACASRSPAAVMEPLTTALYESKLIYYTPSFDDPVRTFCMNPYGAVSLENTATWSPSTAHSYADFKTDRTNFALLVSTDFTEPFDDPIAYGKSIARLANVLGEDIIVQRLGDLHQGHRSTMDRIRRGTVQPTLKGATAGDLAFVLPVPAPHRHPRDAGGDGQDRAGVNGRDTLLYGVEVKFYSARPELDPGLQTPVKNLYAVGDGAGITRGLIQASARRRDRGGSILGIVDGGAPETEAGAGAPEQDTACDAPAGPTPEASRRPAGRRSGGQRRRPRGRPHPAGSARAARRPGLG